MSGCSAFTHWVRFNIPLTLRQTLRANGILNRSTADFRVIRRALGSSRFQDDIAAMVGRRAKIAPQGRPKKRQMGG
jgi:hypothetical protein